MSCGFANGKAFGLTVAILGSLLFGDGDGIALVVQGFTASHFGIDPWLAL